MATRAPVTGILGTIFSATALAGVISQRNSDGGGLLNGPRTKRNRPRARKKNAPNSKADGGKES